ncbi:MAG: class I adenylate-forming enzyme family protein [SAR324 cluster bacterium]
MLIGDLLSRRAGLTPDRPFWREGEACHTYGQLNADADRVARALLAEGLRPGDPVGVCSANGYAYAAFHFGAAKAGLVLAHLNPRSAAEELVAAGERCEARLIAFGAGQREVVERARPRLPKAKRWVQLGAGPLAQVGAVSRDAPAPQWAVAFGDWISAQRPEEPVFPHGAGLRDDQPFQMLFTSGTTGVPKAALISHRAKIAQGVTHALNLGLREGDRILASLPLYHQYAQWLVLVCAPLTAAEVLTRPAFDAGDTWQALQHEGVTHLPCVPTTLYRLLDHPAARAGRAPQLRSIVYGAAPMDARRIRQLRQRFPGVRLFQGFGQTETGYCLGLHDADHEVRPESLGKPDLFSELRLVDDQGRDVPPGQVGEIVARTPYLMNGYHGDPEATAAYFAYGRDWGRTGDLAWRDADGYYRLAGRTKDLIVTGGENVYAAEVERVLLTHPAVAECAVVGLPEPDWGEAVHAAVLLRPGAAADSAGLEAHCRASLAGFKCPRQFSFHGEFPRTANGKVQKFALREGLLRGNGTAKP